MARYSCSSSSDARTQTPRLAFLNLSSRLQTAGDFGYCTVFRPPTGVMMPCSGMRAASGMPDGGDDVGALELDGRRWHGTAGSVVLRGRLGG